MMEQKSICIRSHNIRGFNERKDFLKSQCHSNSHLIHCLQEHWLPPPFKKRAGTNAFRTVHPDFEGFATSAMKEAEETAIRRGRGFGGTGFLYPKQFSHYLSPLTNVTHTRVSAMILKCVQYDLVIINVYMPFLDRSDLNNRLNQYEEVLGYVEFLMSEYEGAEFVVVGDFNCNIFDATHPFTPLLNDFLTSWNLVCTFSLLSSFSPDSCYTRSDSRSRSLLDYIFVSQRASVNVSNVSIYDHHDNFSDHLPVEIEIKLNVTSVIRSGCSSSSCNSNIKWNKISTANINGYFGHYGECT